jgi:hypothetical protein
MGCSVSRRAGRCQRRGEISKALFIDRPQTEVLSGQLDSAAAFSGIKGRPNDPFTRHVTNDAELGSRQQKYLKRGDETRIFWENDHGGMWAWDREGVPAHAKKMISSKKTMFSVRFPRIGFVSIEFLQQGQKYNSQFLTKTILPSFIASESVSRPKLKATAIHLHIDNAKPDDFRLSIRKKQKNMDSSLCQKHPIPPSGTL